MVQQFNILRCFSCKTFQVHQVKKANKWICKVCGEKQSTKKIHGQGSAPDCRKHVQKLNMMQGQYDQLKGAKSEDDDNDVGGGEDEEEQRGSHCDASVGDSKWGKYVEQENTEDNSSAVDELWHGLPITTDRSLFEDNNKTTHNKRKRHHNNTNQTTTRQHNPFTGQENVSTKHRNKDSHSKDNKKNSHNKYSNIDSNDGCSFSAEKVNENETRSKHSRWEKFQGGIPSQYQEHTSRIQSSVKQDGKFSSTRQQMNEKVKNRMGSKLERFQANSSVQEENELQVSRKQTNTKQNGIVGSKWDKFQSNCTPSFENNVEQDEEDDILVTEKQMNEKENRKMGSKWDKYQLNCTSSFENIEEDDDNQFLLNEKEIASSSVNTVEYEKDRSGVVSSPLSGILGLPAFVLDTKATRFEQFDSSAKLKRNDLNNAQNKATTMCTKNLFEIDEELEGEWWNI